SRTFETLARDEVFGEVGQTLPRERHNAPLLVAASAGWTGPGTGRTAELSGHDPIFLRRALYGPRESLDDNGSSESWMDLRPVEYIEPGSERDSALLMALALVGCGLGGQFMVEKAEQDDRRPKLNCSV